jgi:adenylate kinase
MKGSRRAPAGFAGGAASNHLRPETQNKQCPAVILFGPPGSGKGTQAKLLREYIRAPHISTGDMLRTHITAGDEIGRAAEELIKEGKLVPDDLVNELVRQRLARPDHDSGIIFDGYPRTVHQAEFLLDIAKQYGFHSGVVHLVVDHDMIVARLSHRLQCPVCGTVYNLTTNLPKVPGICDRDGAPLVTREDDRESVVRERLHEYDVQTRPILNYFREAGIPMFEIDGAAAPPKEILRRVCDFLVSSGLIPAAAPAATTSPQTGKLP